MYLYKVNNKRSNNKYIIYEGNIMALEDLSTFTTATPVTPTAVLSANVDHLTYLQLLLILEEMLNHTHQFTDD